MMLLRRHFELWFGWGNCTKAVVVSMSVWKLTIRNNTKWLRLRLRYTARNWWTKYSLALPSPIILKKSRQRSSKKRYESNENILQITNANKHTTLRNLLATAITFHSIKKRLFAIFAALFWLTYLEIWTKLLTVTQIGWYWTDFSLLFKCIKLCSITNETIWTIGRLSHLWTYVYASQRSCATSTARQYSRPTQSEGWVRGKHWVVI